MLRTITIQHAEDSYETRYDTERFAFEVVWRYRANLRPTPHKFEDLPKQVQDRLENAVIKTMNVRMQ